MTIFIFVMIYLSLVLIQFAALDYLWDHRND